MSVEAKNITKLYGAQKALDNVSFTIKEGEIVGFLGPNGAGKSTMMKILTGFIPPSSGSASVYGFDVEKDSLNVRANIGYLPEHNPLYYDMYVKEYLDFVSGLHKLKNRKERIADIINLTGLSLEQNKKIGSLSKGYKQRVGLAQALIHNPKVLILDEPTTGLDPNQLAEIRKLIIEIGKTKTIMLSTHIMQEVEAMCHRVIIINKGNIVADKPTQDIQQGVDSKIIVTVEFDKAVEKTKLLSIKGVQRVEAKSSTIWVLESADSIDIRPLLFQFAVQNELTVLTITKEEQRLEDVFKQLTK
ncbi:MAG: gliding motility-associated ABC transporter ATP-binding subunit GldA [Bacteroidetes bacterium]|nr:gliding motility-associated ABC transporter ATP-binding subunit GldA [Bacteroidota bacterium]